MKFSCARVTVGFRCRKRKQSSDLRKRLGNSRGCAYGWSLPETFSERTAHGPQKHFRTNCPTRRTEKSASSPHGKTGARQRHKAKSAARRARSASIGKHRRRGILEAPSATGCAANCRASSPEIRTRRFLQICSVKLTFLRSLLPIAKRQARRSQIRPHLRPDKRLRSRLISERRCRQRFRLRQVLEVNSRCVPTAPTFDSRAPALRSISRTVLAALLH